MAKNVVINTTSLMVIKTSQIGGISDY